MKDLTVKNTDIQNWDYQESVETYSKKLKSWKKLTLEIARELYIAQQYFTVFGNQKSKNNLKRGNLPIVQNRTIGNNLSNSTGKSFSTYLEDIGLVKSTAYTWLERYIPEENRILDKNELRRIKDAKRAEELKRKQQLVEEYRVTGDKPEGWDGECESIWGMSNVADIMCANVNADNEQNMRMLMNERSPELAEVLTAKANAKREFWTERELDFLRSIQLEPIRSLSNQVIYRNSKIKRLKAELDTVLRLLNTDQINEARENLTKLYFRDLENEGLIE